MPNVYYLTVTLHILAAMLWLGGMFFLALVGAPALRAQGEPEVRRQLFGQIGRRFRTVGWYAIAVLVTTGLLNLHFRGWLRWDGVLGSRHFWSTSLGHALMAKLLAVAVMILASTLHDFVLGPTAGRLATGAPGSAAFRSRVAWLARLNAGIGILAVWAAVRLARGG